MCGGAKKDIEKSWESVGIGPRTAHPMVGERTTAESEYIPDSGIGFSR